MKRGCAPVVLMFVALAPVLSGVDLLLRRSPTVEQGNGHMQAGKPEEALAQYDKAMGEAPNEPGVHFNRGAALYGLDRWDEAAQAFLRATETRMPDLKAAAFYNLGNAFFQGQKYEEAAQAFKKSLAYNPSDMRAKWNLELALRRKKEEDKKKEDDKQKNQDQNKDQDKEKEKKNKPEEQKGDEKQDKGDESDKSEDPKQDEKKDGDQKDPAQQQAKQEPPKPPEPKPGEQKPQPPPKPDPEKQAKNPAQPDGQGKEPPRPPGDVSEMEAILDNLERSPKALEQELARIRALNRRPPAKDW